MPTFSPEALEKYVCIILFQNLWPTFFIAWNLEIHSSLTKAVKLEPKSSECWLELGECYWKNGDTENAHRCLTGSLSYVRFISRSCE